MLALVLAIAGCVELGEQTMDESPPLGGDVDASSRDASEDVARSDARPADDADDARDATEPEVEEPVPEDAGGADAWPTDWTISYAEGAPSAVALTAQELAHYLERMGRNVSRVGPVDSEPLCVAGQGTVLLAGNGIGRVRFEGEELTPQTWRIIVEECDDGGARTLLSGRGLLGRQFAAFAWLHQLGVRFYHPEETWIPTTPVGQPAETDTQHTPPVRWRGVIPRGEIPTELMARGDAGTASPDEWRRYVDWVLRNFGTIAPAAGFALDAPDGSGSSYARFRGLGQTLRVDLYHGQGGASGLVPADPRAVAGVTEAVDELLGARDRVQLLVLDVGLDAFSRRGGRGVRADLTALADHIGLQYPGTRALIALAPPPHRPAVPYADTWRDLATAVQDAPTNLGVLLEGAEVVGFDLPDPTRGGAASRAWLRGFANEVYTRRPIVVAMVNGTAAGIVESVPLYLPLTVRRHVEDIGAMIHMRSGRLEGILTWGAGHEWGGWQPEYCAMRRAAGATRGFRDCAEEIAEPFGSAGAAVALVLSDLAAQQEALVADGTVFPYLAGRWPAAVDEPERWSGPPGADGIEAWLFPRVDEWFRIVLPVLERLAAQHADAVARLDDAARGLPTEARVWFSEIHDGVAVTGLRAAHAAHVYSAMVERQNDLLSYSTDLTSDGSESLDAAAEITQQVFALTRARKTLYRYEPTQRATAGGTSGRADVNGTPLPRRYLNHVEFATEYRLRDSMAEASLRGGWEGVTVPDVVIGPSELLTVAVDGEAWDSFRLTIDGRWRSDRPVTERRLEEPGIYSLQVDGVRDGAPQRAETNVARVQWELRTGFAVRITEPPGGDVVEVVFPSIVVGPIDDERVAIGFGVDETGRVPLGVWTVVPRVDEGDALLRTGPARLVVPGVNHERQEIFASLVLEETRLHVPADGSRIEIDGFIPTSTAIELIGIYAGFDETGARGLIASALGYTPDTLPERVRFALAYDVISGDPAP